MLARETKERGWEMKAVGDGGGGGGGRGGRKIEKERDSRFTCSCFLSSSTQDYPDMWRI